MVTKTHIAACIINRHSGIGPDFANTRGEAAFCSFEMMGFQKVEGISEP